MDSGIARKRNINGELIASSPMPFTMDCPVCLIENKVKDERAELVVNPEAIDILSKIQKPVVVSVVGKHQTGKSYLMNRLAGARKGFTLGSTIQVQTKGIWMWCVPHPKFQDRILVLLDTEGLGDVEKGDAKNDRKIFTLAGLLSSALVYNSKGAICQDDLDKLKYVGDLIEKIKARTRDPQEEKKTFSTNFPMIIWAVRDFMLELKIDGQGISADDYLETALKLKTSETSSKEKEYNELRRHVQTCFEKRKCFLFDTPTDSARALKNLEQLPDDRLSEDFLSQSALFRDYIFQNAEVKREDTTVDVTGHRLGELAKIYTEVINSNVVSFMEKENIIAVQEVTKYYEERMKTIVLPTDTHDQFLNLSTQYEEEAQQMLLKRLNDDTDKKFFKKCMENVKKIRNEFSVMNDEKSQEKPGGLERSKKNLKQERKICNGGKRAKVEPVPPEDRTSEKNYEIMYALSQKEEEGGDVTQFNTAIENITSHLNAIYKEIEKLKKINLKEFPPQAK